MLRTVGLVAAVLGGLAWIARWLVAMGGEDPGWGGAAHLAGLGLLLAAFAVVGAALVSSSAAWLRVLVAVAAPLLVWSVYSVLQAGRDTATLDGVLGLLALGTTIAVVLGDRRRRPARTPRGRHGAHSAR